MEPPASPLHDPARDLYVVPVRHHSPACAAHLARLIEAVAPAAILIEGPCDFDPLIPLVTDERTRPPVAIVAMREAKAERGRRRTASYYPLCAHSPEYVALAAGAARGVPARFIDLPSLSREMADETEEDTSRSLLGDEHVFDSGDYVRALAAKLGCRDGNEAWDHLFEARIAETDWHRFFADVGQYCACLRGATEEARMARDGTLAREAQMRALIAEARAAHVGPIVAVVGGFHSSALIDGANPPGKPVAPRKGDGGAFLIRYGHRQLNALSGYAAGLPLPGYYDSLWRRAGVRPEEQPFSALTLDMLTGFAAHLREGGLGGAPSFPVLASAAEQAERLARLRGRPGPLRTDLIDAIRSTFLKEEASRAGAPLLRELDAWLTGSAIGDVPPSAGSPPLVEAVRAQARRLGFSVADGERRSRDLDIYREERHRAASRFCHAMALISTPFAQRTGGPDFRNDVDLDRLHEIWSVCWSPMVESRLIELAAEADTLPEALAIAIADQFAQLREQGRGRSATAAIDLFAAACRAGIGGGAGAILAYVEAEAIEDPELGPVVAALADLVRILRNRAMLGIEDPAPIERLIGALWQRALFLLPDIAQAGPEQARPLLDALVTLRALTGQARAGHAPIDVAPFDERLVELLDASLHPTLAGAVAAYALIAGQMAEEAFAARLKGELEGGYVVPADRLAFLTGVIALARELLWTMPALVDTLDTVIAGADDDGFVELLPHVRLALGPLDPREIDRLAQAVAGRHGGGTVALVSTAPIDEATLLRNLALDRALAARLAEEGVA